MADIPLPRDPLASEVDIEAVSLNSIPIRSGSILDVDIESNTSGLLTAADQPFDVSGATVAVQEATALDVSAATVTVDDSGNFALSATPLDAALDSNGTDHLHVTHDTADTSATSATTASTGSANAAQVTLGNHRTSLSVGWDVAGACDITIEGSNDGGTSWHPVNRYSPGAAEVNGADLVVGWDMVRAYISANVNELAISAKGV